MQHKRLLELKAHDWKEWAFTDGSCITSKENGSQSIGAGDNRPQSNKITTAKPGGTSINKTIINRSKLAGIFAALINEYTCIATDSANALWQIRNSILYPQRMKQNKHVKLLETIGQHIQQSKDTIHLYKVKLMLAS